MSQIVEVGSYSSESRKWPCVDRLRVAELFTHTLAHTYTHINVYPHLLRGDQTILRPNLNAVISVALLRNRLLGIPVAEESCRWFMIQMQKNANMATSLYKGSTYGLWRHAVRGGRGPLLVNYSYADCSGGFHQAKSFTRFRGFLLNRNAIWKQKRRCKKNFKKTPTLMSFKQHQISKCQNMSICQICHCITVLAFFLSGFRTH